jgi:hypothetical protein
MDQPAPIRALFLNKISSALTKGKTFFFAGFSGNIGDANEISRWKQCGRF